VRESPAGFANVVATCHHATDSTSAIYDLGVAHTEAAHPRRSYRRSHRGGRRQAGTSASARPTRSARAATKKGTSPRRAPVVEHPHSS